VTTKTERYNGLDLGRAILMLLGIVFHSALIFKVNGGWEVSNNSTSSIFNEISQYIHYFRMEAFYIIAGFFFFLVFEKHGLKATLKDRLLKLGIPLVIVGLTFNSMMNLLIDDNRSNYMGVNYILEGQWVFHLWFIGNLILYYVLLSPLLLILCRWKKTGISNKFVLIITFILTPILVALLSQPAANLPGRLLFVSFGAFNYYLPFFILGMIYWKTRSIVIPFLTIQVSIVLLLVFSFLNIINQHVSIVELSWTLSKAFDSLMNLCLAISVICFFSSLGKNKSKMVSKLVNSSYSIYLLHQPITILIFVFLIEDLNINAYLGFFALCTLVYLSSYFLHTKIVMKYPLLLFLLNGKK